jgi:integrase/recombinase XerD
LLDIAALLPSWQLALRAERKSPGTVKTYSAGVEGFLRWCQSTGTQPELTKPTVQAFVASVLDGGAEAATAHARLKGVRLFSAWLADEKEIDEDPLEGMRSRWRRTTSSAWGLPERF